MEKPDSDWFDDYLNMDDDEDSELVGQGIREDEFDDESDRNHICPKCNGTGIYIDDIEPCDHCDGMGYEWWLP